MEFDYIFDNSKEFEEFSKLSIGELLLILPDLEKRELLFDYYVGKRSMQELLIGIDYEHFFKLYVEHAEFLLAIKDFEALVDYREKIHRAALYWLLVDSDNEVHKDHS